MSWHGLLHSCIHRWKLVGRVLPLRRRRTVSRWVLWCLLGWRRSILLSLLFLLGLVILLLLLLLLLLVVEVLIGVHDVGCRLAVSGRGGEQMGGR